MDTSYSHTVTQTNQTQLNLGITSLLESLFSIVAMRLSRNSVQTSCMSISSHLSHKTTHLCMNVRGEILSTVQKDGARELELAPYLHWFCLSLSACETTIVFKIVHAHVLGAGMTWTFLSRQIVIRLCAPNEYIIYTTRWVATPY